MFLGPIFIESSRPQARLERVGLDNRLACTTTRVVKVSRSASDLTNTIDAYIEIALGPR
jgi:hypothetical protein